MNKVIVTGRFTQHNDVRVTQSGKKVLRNSIAVRRNYKNPQTNEYDSDFINIVTMNENTVNYIEQYTQKGMLVELVGQWRSGSYENREGQKVYTNELMVEQVSSLEKKKEEQPKQEELVITADELPF